MKTLEYILTWFIIPMVGGFIGAVIVGIIREKFDK